jgi:hyaluronoglucosaminidase
MNISSARAFLPFWLFVATAWTLLGTVAARAGETASGINTNFQITLPTGRRDFPEPLPPGAQPGFKIRGTKGWAWTPEQYLEEIPFIAQYKMNFLMNCYISMFDIEHHAKWYDGDANRWWEDFPPAKKAAYEKVVRSAQAHGLQFCFSMNPNLFSKRLVNDDSPDSVDLLYKHYAWMQGLGVKWFNLSLDDAANGINAATQAKVCNEIFHRLRAGDSGAQMIFCPTYYWGDGTLPKQQPYLEDLARELDPEIYVFWTGDAVRGKVTRRAAETFHGIIKHPVILWDNYPVNDDRPTMNLGPVTGRDPDLGDVLEGYMSNPMCRQNELNRIPLATCADYAYNPRAYDPARSIGQAIWLQAKRPAQREVLRDLVESYPGFFLNPAAETQPGFNPVRVQMDQILALPQSRLAARAYLDWLQNLARRFDEQFPREYSAEKKSLDDDLTYARQKLAARYP